MVTSEQTFYVLRAFMNGKNNILHCVLKVVTRALVTSRAGPAIWDLLVCKKYYLPHLLYPTVTTHPAFIANLFACPTESLMVQSGSPKCRSREIGEIHLLALLRSGLSPILEIEIREFRQGWEFDKGKEPRWPARTKLREGNENWCWPFFKLKSLVCQGTTTPPTTHWW